MAGVRSFRTPLRQAGAEKDCLKDEPFRGEAVERGQGGDGRAGDQRRKARRRHPVNEAPEPLHVARARRGENGAGAEEKRALEDRVVERVKERGGERERGRRLHSVRLERQRQAERREDNPDVLDRAIGERPLEIALHHRGERAQSRGEAADHEARRSPPPAWRGKKIEGDADEGVDRDLGHRPAHQRRDMARRGRVGERQPHMQGREPGLRACANQRQRQRETGEQHREGATAHA